MVLSSHAYEYGYNSESFQKQASVRVLCRTIRLLRCRERGEEREKERDRERAKERENEREKERETEGERDTHTGRES